MSLECAGIVCVAVAIFALMAVEAAVASRHERALLRHGALEVRRDIYPVMRIVYPAAFLAMALEGAWRGQPPRTVMASGVAVFIAAKAIKYWAAATLGERWTFRVIILAGAPLITTGPYRWLRHPNYVGVVGELVGAALLFGAPVAGIIGVAAFSLILWRRIAVEEQALGI
jgi:methyltransferase